MYDFAKDFAALGIERGDVVLMHSSMKALGTSETPEYFLNSLCDYLGEEGTLLLPALSYDNVTAERPFFSVRDTPACIGLLPNTFLKMPGVMRSLHPTHSVAARGRLARKLTEKHRFDETPVGPNSPFMLLPGVGGKILMVGDINDHLTFMHGVEEIAPAPYQLSKARTRYVLEDYDGQRREVFLFAHDSRTVKAQRYGRFENLMIFPDVRRGNICRASCTLIDSRALIEKAVAKMREDVYYFVDME